MRYKLWAWALHWLQSRCRHSKDGVSADYLEGQCEPIQIKYCHRCGAIRPDFNGDTTYQWDRPMPHWYRDGGGS